MHHNLETKPVPEKALYINKPDLADVTINYYGSGKQEEESQADHIRVYVPLDLSADAILRRLRFLIFRYKEANEQNGFDFSVDVGRLVSQIEIYDQVWFIREGRTRAISDDSESEKHSSKAVELVRRFVTELEEIPDGCAELFPFELIDELRREYL